MVGKIPLLIDNNPHNPSSPITVMESSAILLYLVETYDPDHHFHFSSSSSTSSPVYKSQLLQWLFFWSASGQPQQAGLNHFKRFAEVVVDSCKLSCPIPHSIGDIIYMRCAHNSGVKMPLRNSRPRRFGFTTCWKCIYLIG